MNMNFGEDVLAFKGEINNKFGYEIKTQNLALINSKSKKIFKYASVDTNIGWVYVLRLSHPSCDNVCQSYLNLNLLATKLFPGTMF